MSAPILIRGNYSDHFGSATLPVLEEIFRSSLAMHPSRRSEVFKIVSTDRDIWQSSEMHDMPLFTEMAEGESYSFEAPKQGANKTLTIAKFGLGFSVSEEAVDDGKFEFVADAIRKMANSGVESQEIQAMNIFNNGFGTETVADGQPLFDLAHPLPRGGTYRNELSTAADLSVTSLEQALLDFETQFVGDTGIIYNMAPKVLLVHPSNKRLAKELIGSDLKPETADNNMNPYKQEGLRVVSSPHLTDTDAWFLLADPSMTGLRIVSRKPIETKAAAPDSVGFMTDSIYYKARYREKIAAIHGYGAFGSPGA